MISKKYNEILKKLEKGIVGKNNLELAKSLFSELNLIYVDSLEKISEDYNRKILDIEERVEKLEEILEMDLHQNELEEDSSINLSESITCPYCGSDFLVEHDENTHEITCPECDNLIELDWGEFEDDM